MEQMGIIVDTDNDMALVKIIRSAACGETCGNCNICGSNEMRKWVQNDIGAVEGNHVKLYLRGTSLLIMAFTAYIAPILTAALGCVIITTFIKTRVITDMLSIGILAAAVWVCAKTKVFKGGKYQSRIVEVVTPEK